MSRIKNRKIMSNINMVPFIDVVLVLLVVFMIGAPMMIQGLKVNLPIADNKPITNKNLDENLIISINADGNYFLDIESKKSNDHTNKLSIIIKMVQSIFSHNPKINIFIKADKNIEYGVVMRLMSKLQSVGITNVGLVTTPVGLDR